MIAWAIISAFLEHVHHQMIVKSKWNKVYKTPSLLLFLSRKHHLKCCPRVSCVVINQLAFLHLGESDAVKNTSIPRGGVSNQRKVSSGVTFSSFKDTKPIMRPPPSCPHLNLITSQRLHLLIPSYWELGLQAMNFEA